MEGDTALTRAELARLIDHTQLRAYATQRDMKELCAVAAQCRFACVSINPVWTSYCAKLLAGSGIGVDPTIGFPLGANTARIKVEEAREAIKNGATEIDMVINVGALKSGDLDAVEADIAAVVAAAHAAGALVKVIIETALLSDDEKATACRLAQAAGAEFVKTSTGFGPGGATVEDVALMRRVVGPEMGVKASGGVRNYADVQAMVAAGATRIGASAGVAIVDAARRV